MSDEKKRTSVSLPRETYEWLSDAPVENSALIAELLDEYRQSRTERVAGLEMQLKHAKTERDDLKQQYEHAEERVADLEERLSEARVDETAVIDDERESLDTLPDRQLTADNPAVKNWAEKAGLSPEELLARL